MPPFATHMTGEYDWHLVVLAVVLCFFASAVAINLFHRAQATMHRARFAWLSLDAAAAGFGIWATHFVAMLAYHPGVGGAYDLSLTILSLIIATLVTGIGFLAALHDLERWTPVLGGALIGCGIAAMHYTGMMALQLPGRLTWSPDLVIASVVFGIVLAAFSFYIATKRNNWPYTLLAAGLLSSAILATHFTGMTAATFVPDPSRINGGGTLSPTSLAFVVASVATAILGICLVLAVSASHSEAALQAQKYLLDTALENMLQGLCMFESDGRIMLFNDRYAKMAGLSPTSLKGMSLLDIFELRKASGSFTGDPEKSFQQVLSGVREGNSKTRVFEMEVGRWLRVAEQPMKGGGWVSTLEDITRWRELQEQIAYMAHHDALTGLPNRAFFREQLARELARTSRSEEIAVHCIDLDNFKDINDALGPPVGDQLLKEVAGRFRAAVRAIDTVARIGGDEFAIIQIGPEIRTSDASSLAGRINELASEPYAIAGQQIFIGTSIGISVAPDDATDPDLLLKKAEIALHLAKEGGRGTYRFFEFGMDARAQARRLLQVDMRAALLRDEFEVYYQPIYAIETGQIVCFEALLRWNHPIRGTIQPADFIPLAEDTGLILPIGNWVLRRACKDASLWSQDAAVAVNLSPRQFKSRDLVASVMAALSDSGLPANRLELEITETVFLRNSEATLEILSRLREVGIRLSMDDFGTGYSSLSYLRRFRFDKIKIDASFVRELPSRDESMAIVRAVTGLGRSLGITTIAEGVETSEQLELLRQEGCDQVQGYLFSPPRPAREVERILTDGHWRSIA
jgi:diguanylate cyclase (GGDEF)-like protein/PAS domain S-box-containing protein